MAGDGTLPQEAEGKKLPTSSRDKNRSLDGAREQKPDARSTQCDERRKNLYESKIIPIESEIRKNGLRQRFYEAVREGELEMVNALLENNDIMKRLDERFTRFEANAFQVAVAAGQRETFSALMKKINGDDRSIRILEAKNTYGETILTLAAAEGCIEIVKELVRTRVGLVDIPNDNGDLPVTVAALFGKKDIADFLLPRTLELYGSNPSCGDVKEEEEEKDVVMTNSTQSSQDDGDFKALQVSMTTQVSGHDERNYSFKLVNEDKHQAKLANYQSRHHSFRLFKACINSQFYDIASEVFKLFPSVCMNEMAKEDGETMISIAKAPIELLEPPRQRNFVSRFHESWARFHDRWARGLERWGNSRMPWSQFAKSWYQNNYGQPKSARLLLRQICRHIWIYKNPDNIMQRVLARPILTAVKHDNRGFIVAVIDLCPDAFWLKTDKLSHFSSESSTSSPQLSKDLLHIYFSLTKKAKTGLLRTIQADRNGNTILHHAAKLSSAKTLSRFPSPPLQMQKEIHWFKKAEKIVPVFKGVENKDNLTPMDLFVQEHKKLKKAGEKWFKETASSCSVVATLIITIMFSATFTVPGGYDSDTGRPINLGSKYFTIFIISDALSLFLSCTSAMLFLGLYTLDFQEEDFLIKLPLTLTCGIFTLFLSIVTMVIAFIAAFFLTLKETLLGMTLPMLMLASIPVIVYSLSYLRIFIKVLLLTLNHLFK